MVDLQTKVKRCSRPGCTTQIKPGQLACRDHWNSLTGRLRDRLVFAWEQRKANPHIPELVNIHRALLLECLKEWGFTNAQIREAIKTGAPKTIDPNCPWCGMAGGLHRVGCQKLN